MCTHELHMCRPGMTCQEASPGVPYPVMAHALERADRFGQQYWSNLVASQQYRETYWHRSKS